MVCRYQLTLLQMIRMLALVCIVKSLVCCVAFLLLKITRAYTLTLGFFYKTATSFLTIFLIHVHGPMIQRIVTEKIDISSRLLLGSTVRSDFG